MSQQYSITLPAQQPSQYEAITLEQFYRRRSQRKRRVAKRLFKKAPLFAVELMRTEFPEVTLAEVQEIIARPTRKSKSVRSKKIGLKKYGRYPLYFGALERYRESGDVAHLAEAQGLRNRMAKDFLFEMRCQGERRTYRLTATASLRTVRQIAALKFSTFEDLEAQWDEVTKYGI